MLPRVSVRPVAAVAIALAVLLVAVALSIPARAHHSNAEAADAGASVPACGPNYQGGNQLPSGLPVRDPAAAPPPAITAEAAVVVDAETGRVLYGLDEHRRRSPASTTKIMTAILALENRPLDDTVVSETDAVTMSAAG